MKQTQHFFSPDLKGAYCDKSRFLSLIPNSYDTAFWNGRWSVLRSQSIVIWWVGKSAFPTMSTYKRSESEILYWSLWEISLYQVQFWGWFPNRHIPTFFEIVGRVSHHPKAQKISFLTNWSCMHFCPRGSKKYFKFQNREENNLFQVKKMHWWNLFFVFVWFPYRTSFHLTI